MLLAHKVELRPSKEQHEKLFQWVGTTRHCFNNLLGNFSKEGLNFLRKLLENISTTRYVLRMNGILTLVRQYFKNLLMI